VREPRWALGDTYGAFISYSMAAAVAPAGTSKGTQREGRGGGGGGAAAAAAAAVAGCQPHTVTDGFTGSQSRTRRETHTHAREV
jgi:hypothetical protein